MAAAALAVAAAACRTSNETPAGASGSAGSSATEKPSVTSSAPLPAPAPRALAVSEAEALERVRKLPEVAELAKRSSTTKTLEQRRQLGPAVRIRTSADPSCRDECRHVIDVTSESDAGTDPPELRFLVDARTEQLFVVAPEPLHGKPMAYDVWRPLEQRHRKNLARIWALPEVVALQRKLMAKRNIGDLNGEGTQADVEIYGGDPPEPGCSAGTARCQWVYSVHMSNGLVASRWHSIHIDHASDGMLIDNVLTGEMVPYTQKARWK